MTVTPFLLVIIAAQLMLFLSNYDLQTFNCPVFSTIIGQHWNSYCHVVYESYLNIE